MNVELINEFIPWDTQWTICEGGFHVEPMPGTSGETRFISNEDLCKIDPRLPMGIPLLKDSNNDDGSRIRAMLKLWMLDMHLVGVNGTLFAINNAEDVSIQSDKVSIKCTGYYYTEVRVPDTQIKLLLPERNTIRPIISREWLDEKHPGWAHRFTIASDLGLSLNDAVRAMINGIYVETCKELPQNLDYGSYCAD